MRTPFLSLVVLPLLLTACAGSERVPGTSRTVPSAPTAVVAVPGNAAASVSWQPPADTGGVALLGYTVTASPGGHSARAAAGETSATLTGLSNGTAYTFTVVARNAVGAGSPSAPSAAVTPSASGFIGPEQRCIPACGPLPGGSMVRVTAENPIVSENAKPGDPAWRDGVVARNRQLELFLSTDAAEAGDTVVLRASTQEAAAFTVTATVYRLGDYGGAGARKVWTSAPFEVVQQPDCPMSPTTGRAACAWSESMRFQIGADWTSGLYAVKVQRADGVKRFAPLVVRDRRAAEILLTAAVTTYQAYNGWGGASFYEDRTGTLPSRRATEVSFDRPYEEGEGLGQMLNWEWHLARFLEREGYDVTYATNVDFKRWSNLLDGISMFVHGGHDEYWGAEERAQVDLGLRSGRISLAHFGGNGAYWRIRLEDGAQGEPLRTIACYKTVTADPIPGSTIRYRDAPEPHPELRLFGAMYGGRQLFNYPMAVMKPEHWLFEGTGLKRGAPLHFLLGYEFDLTYGGADQPAVNISLESPVFTPAVVPMLSQTVDRTLDNGRLVFSASTISWALALNPTNPWTYDRRVERMTANVLERGLAHRRPRRELAPVTDGGPKVSPPIGAWATAVEPFAGVVGEAGFRDGPASSALFNAPTGVAVDAVGRVFVADTKNNRIRMISTDALSTVSTLAGTGAAGAQDGAGSEATFNGPTGVAVGTAGEVYVADTGNHAIRLLTPGPSGTWSVSTLAGKAGTAGFADGLPQSARFTYPVALAVNSANDLFIADQGNHRIRWMAADRQQVTTLAGGATSGAVDGAGLTARFFHPSAVAVEPNGDLVVFEAGNQLLRRVSAAPGNTVTRLAGDAQNPGFADGTGGSARFRTQLGIATSPDGTVFVADTANFRVRAVTPGSDSASTNVATFAGTSWLGTTGTNGADATFGALAGIVVLPGGTQVLVSDSYHHTLRVLRR